MSVPCYFVHNKKALTAKNRPVFLDRLLEDVLRFKRKFFHRFSRLVSFAKEELIMKTKKEEYIDKMANELKEWSARIDELESRVGTAKADVKMAYENRIRELKEKRETLSRKLQEIRESSGEAWEAMTAGLETAWKDFKGALSAAREKFKKAA
jgi:predicted  nucleic acid-binding Zn-ribbon protein